MSALRPRSQATNRTRRQLLNALTTTAPKGELWRLLGYSDRRTLNRALRTNGIRRTWTPCGVPVVEVRLPS